MKATRKIIDFLDHHLEWLFLPIFLAAGMALIFLVPLGQNPDEPFHVYRAYQLSNFQNHADTQIIYGNKQIGGAIPKAYSNVFSHASSGYANQQDQNAAGSSFQNFPNTAVYSPLVYVPDIIAIWIGRALNLSPTTILLLCRILTLLITAALLFWSIKLAVIGKWILFVVALLPSVVGLSSAISADALTIGICALFVSLTLRLTFGKDDERHTRRLLVAHGLASLGLALIKPAYIPLIILNALIFINPKLRSRHSKWWIAGVSFTAFALYAAWIHSVSYVDINFNTTSNPTLQMNYILGHPFTYLSLMINNLFSNNQLASFGVIRLNNWALPNILVFILIACLTLAIFLRSDGEVKLGDFAKKQSAALRCSLLAVAVVSWVMINTSLYVYYTNVKASAIAGVQDRYYLPILPLILLSATGSSALQKPTYKKVFVVACIIIALTATILTTGTHYLN